MSKQTKIDPGGVENILLNDNKQNAFDQNMLNNNSSLIQNSEEINAENNINQSSDQINYIDVNSINITNDNDKNDGIRRNSVSSKNQELFFVSDDILKDPLAFTQAANDVMSRRVLNKYLPTDRQNIPVFAGPEPNAEPVVEEESIFFKSNNDDFTAFHGGNIAQITKMTDTDTDTPIPNLPLSSDLLDDDTLLLDSNIQSKYDSALDSSLDDILYSPRKSKFSFDNEDEDESENDRNENSVDTRTIFSDISSVSGRLMNTISSAKREVKTKLSKMKNSGETFRNNITNSERDSPIIGSRIVVVDAISPSAQSSREFKNKSANDNIFGEQEFYTLTSTDATSPISRSPTTKRRLSYDSKLYPEEVTDFNIDNVYEDNHAVVSNFRENEEKNVSITVEIGNPVRIPYHACPPLLNGRVAKTISSVAGIARMSLRATSAVGEVFFNGVRISTSAAIRIGRQSLVHTILSNRKVQVSLALGLLKAGNVAFGFPETAVRLIQAPFTSESDEQRITTKKNGFIKRSFNYLVPSYINLLDSYTTASIFLVYNAFSLADIVNSSTLDFLSRSSKASIETSGEIIQIIDGLFGNTETSKALAACISIVSSELFGFKSSHLKSLPSLDLQIMAKDGNKPGKIKATVLITKALLAYTCLQYYNTFRWDAKFNPKIEPIEPAFQRRMIASTSHGFVYSGSDIRDTKLIDNISEDDKKPLLHNDDSDISLETTDSLDEGKIINLVFEAYIESNGLLLSGGYCDPVIYLYDNKSQEQTENFNSNTDTASGFMDSGYAEQPLNTNINNEIKKDGVSNSGSLKNISSTDSIRNDEEISLSTVNDSSSKSRRPSFSRTYNSMESNRSRSRGKFQGSKNKKNRRKSSLSTDKKNLLPDFLTKSINRISRKVAKGARVDFMKESRSLNGKLGKEFDDSNSKIKTDLIDRFVSSDNVVKYGRRYKPKDNKTHSMSKSGQILYSSPSSPFMLDDLELSKSIRHKRRNTVSAQSGDSYARKGILKNAFNVDSNINWETSSESSFNNSQPDIAGGLFMNEPDNKHDYAHVEPTSNCGYENEFLYRPPYFDAHPPKLEKCLSDDWLGNHSRCESSPTTYGTNDNPLYINKPVIRRSSISEGVNMYIPLTNSFSDDESNSSNYSEDYEAKYTSSDDEDSEQVEIKIQEPASLKLSADRTEDGDTLNPEEAQVGTISAMQVPVLRTGSLRRKRTLSSQSTWKADGELFNNDNYPLKSSKSSSNISTINSRALSINKGSLHNNNNPNISIRTDISGPLSASVLSSHTTLPYFKTQVRKNDYVNSVINEEVAFEGKSSEPHISATESSDENDTVNEFDPNQVIVSPTIAESLNDVYIANMYFRRKRWILFQSLARFAKFASGAYGTNFLKILGVSPQKGTSLMPVGVKPIASGGGDENMALNKSQSNIGDKTLMSSHHNHETFALHTKLPVEHVLYSTYNTAISLNEPTLTTPVYYICVDTLTSSVVLTLRGTLGLSDLVTDLSSSYIYYMFRNNLEGKIHSGMLESAERICNSETIKDSLILALKRHPGFKLVLVGHSLGGGVASLLGMLWTVRELNKEDGEYYFYLNPELGFPNERRVLCFGYGTPGTVSADLAYDMRNLVSSVIYRDDLIPWLSMGAIRDFRRIAVNLCNDEELADAIIRKSLGNKLPKFLADMLFGEESDRIPGTRTTKLEKEEEKEGRSWFTWWRKYSFNQAKSNLKKEKEPVKSEEPNSTNDPDIWFWDILSTVRSNIRAEKLFPPGRIYWMDTRDENFVSHHKKTKEEEAKQNIIKEEIAIISNDLNTKIQIDSNTNVDTTPDTKIKPKSWWAVDLTKSTFKFTVRSTTACLSMIVPQSIQNIVTPRITNLVGQANIESIYSNPAKPEINPINEGINEESVDSPTSTDDMKVQAREGRRVRIHEVVDLERCLSEFVFSKSMFMDHSPILYEKSLSRLVIAASQVPNLTN